MEWWNAVGAYYAQTGIPALAMDMATGGPQHSDLGYALIDKSQRTAAPLEIYGPDAGGQ